MAWADVLKAVIPIIVAALAWLLGQVSSANERLVKIESAMPALITREGVPTDSPLSAERRAILKDALQREINDLHVRVMLLEQLDKRNLSHRE
jgi:hypothetical protein